MSWRDFAAARNISYGGNSIIDYAPSRTQMSIINEVFHDDNIKNLSESDIYWDEIQSITQLGVEDVYDLTIDKVHNFVANDIIVHNSIEQDADIVAFIYRPEYYQIMEDEQGQSLKG
jgi:replicative DNA helicase